METPTDYPAKMIAKADPKKIDDEVWNLCQILWRIESVSNTASRAIDGSGEGSQFCCDLNGSFQAIADLCKKAQDTLELGIQRPLDNMIAEENHVN